MSKTLLCTAALTAAFVLQASPAQAALINLDVGQLALPNNPAVSVYGQGAGVFGSATSLWNNAAVTNQTGLSLLDDAGAATTVKVTYTVQNTYSSGGNLTGVFSGLGSAGLYGATAVLFEGLVIGAGYDLVIYSGSPIGASTFSAGGMSATVSQTPNPAVWNSLSLGAQYVQFSLTADNLGQVSFTANAGDPFNGVNPSLWSAVQLKQTTAGPGSSTVPEPGTAALVGLAVLAAWRSRHRVASKA
jgi:hypothetical protein